MNWDDPAIQEAVGRRMNSMLQYDLAVRPGLRVPESALNPGWRAPDWMLFPGHRASEEELFPAYRGATYQDPTYFLPALLFGLQFARG